MFLQVYKRIFWRPRTVKVLFETQKSVRIKKEFRVFKKDVIQFIKLVI